MNIDIVSDGTGHGHVYIDGQGIPSVRQVNVVLTPGKPDIVTITVFGKLKMSVQPAGINVIEETLKT